MAAQPKRGFRRLAATIAIFFVRRWRRGEGPECLDPSSSFGRQTMGHVTMHFPLMLPSLPVHRNHLQMTLISSIAHRGKPSAMMV